VLGSRLSLHLERIGRLELSFNQGNQAEPMPGTLVIRHGTRELRRKGDTKQRPSCTGPLFGVNDGVTDGNSYQFAVTARASGATTSFSFATRDGVEPPR
jgi:hypothetical protein